jgi:hypothetical protein
LKENTKTASQGNRKINGEVQKEISKIKRGLRVAVMVTVKRPIIDVTERIQKLITKAKNMGGYIPCLHNGCV